MDERPTMDEMIVRALSEELTELERRKLANWRAASEANDAEYRQALALWTMLDAIGDDPYGEAPVGGNSFDEDPADEEPGGDVSASRRPLGPPPPAEAIVSEARRRRKRSSARAAGRRFLGSPWVGYAAAAAALCVLVIGALQRELPAPGLTPLESSTGSSDVVTMALSDGSVVRAAADTRISFPSGTDRREVALDGRAFFAVTTATEPFVVRTSVGEAVVTGTRFEVDAAGRDLRLVVVEGTVELRGDGGPVEVHEGQVAFLASGSAARVVDREDPWSLLDWEGGLLVFQGTPLARVAAEVGRHFGTEVTVADELADRRVTAWFEDESLEEVVSAVCVVAGAMCRVSGATVAIGGR